MLSPERREAYRHMTTDQRLALTAEMVRENTPYLLLGSPEVVARRFELLLRQDDERNENMLRPSARTKDRP